MTTTYLVTGSAGFIGFHMCQNLLAAGHKVIGLDAMTDYYDITLKERRVSILEASANFTAVNIRLEDGEALTALFAREKPDVVIHLAAQAGVRYSIDAPRSYVDSNLIGTFNILEAARAHKPAHLLCASTSSVYGANTKMPYTETDKTESQMSFYAATKKANEAMAHSYAHLYDIPTTMFRFFTVYGPWGRPDMALFKFTKAILAGEPIDIYNHGEMSRDFTYVDDIVNAIALLVDATPQRGAQSDEDSLSSVAPYRVVNIGNSSPTKLMDFITMLENALGREAKKNMMEMQAGDVHHTWANTELLEKLTGYKAQTDLKAGVKNFVDWYIHHYN